MDHFGFVKIVVGELETSEELQKAGFNNTEIYEGSHSSNEEYWCLEKCGLGLPRTTYEIRRSKEGVIIEIKANGSPIKIGMFQIV
jgi:hypothetical protein